MQNMFKYALSATSVAMLVACGGGGDADVSTATTVAPVRTVFQQVLTTQRTYTAASADGMQLSLTFNPKPDAIFSEGTGISKKVSVSAVLRRNNAVIDTSVDDIYFKLAPLEVVAFAKRKIERSTTIPETAQNDATGQIFFSQGVGRGLSSVPPLEGTWSVEAVDSGLAWVCITDKLGYGLLSSPSFESTTVSTYCFKTSESGAISGFKASISSDEKSTINRPVINTVIFDR